MKATSPFPESRGIVPTGAVTVELSGLEVLEAVCVFVGNKRGESFRAQAHLSLRSVDGALVARLSYWRPD